MIYAKCESPSLRHTSSYLLENKHNQKKTNILNHFSFVVLVAIVVPIPSFSHPLHDKGAPARQRLRTQSIGGLVEQHEALVNVFRLIFAL